jgi:MurNAc alpha-1-phosphate uridylyltransferase
VIGVMILAAGRGERMRPLTDATPKPLLPVAGRPLLAWQIEALARAGFRRIVINASHLRERLTAAFGDGTAFGVHIDWSLEEEPLETAGGVVTALPLLPAGPALVVSGDIWTAFDYATLRPRAAAMQGDPAAARAHMVMVPNPVYHPRGDFALRDGRLHIEGEPRLTYGNIGLYDTALFHDLRPGVRAAMLPLYREWIAAGLVSGERYDGPWANVGTPTELAALDASLAVHAPPSG